MLPDIVQDTKPTIVHHVVDPADSLSQEITKIVKEIDQATKLIHFRIGCLRHAIDQKYLDLKPEEQDELVKAAREYVLGWRALKNSTSLNRATGSIKSEAFYAFNGDIISKLR